MSSHRIPSNNNAQHHHAHNHHTLVNHPWRASESNIDRFLNKNKQRLAKPHKRGGESSVCETIVTEFSSSQSSLFSRSSSASRRSRSPTSPLVRRIPSKLSCSPSSIRTDSATAHHSHPPPPPSTQVPSLDDSSIDQRGTIASITSPRSFDSCRRYPPPPPLPRSERGVFRSDNNDDLKKPQPPRSPKVCLKSLSPDWSVKSLPTAPSATRPNPLTSQERSLSSGSTSTCSSIPGLGRPPKTALSTSSAGNFAPAVTNNTGPIDIDTMEAWQEDTASVDSSLIMMDIEDPAEQQQQVAQPPPSTPSPCKCSDQSPTAGDASDSSTPQQKWMKGWGASKPPSPAEDTVGLEQSSVWNSDNDDDSDSSSPYLDDTLSSAAAEDQPDTESTTLPSPEDQPQQPSSEEIDEQDVDPLAPFMRLERITDLIAESDDEAELQQLLDQFHRFPVLDERESERILAGYQRGFEPDPPPKPIVHAPIPKPPSTSVAFEI
mmetsp:Transcript_13611/g.29876  ORF Transcript_13611/g.29876 Transcript_13611/m.29876 type:complete len:490 (+) Transcript_13611:349-1818(+)